MEVNTRGSSSLTLGATGSKNLARGQSVVDQLLAQSYIFPADEAYAETKKGLLALVGQLQRADFFWDRIDRVLLDRLIAQLDEAISLQIDEVLHHPEFKRLESAWRGLKFVVDQTNFRENIKIDLLNVSKEDLQEDFAQASEIVQSGLYKRVYTAEYGQFGGEPYAVMIGNYAFDHLSPDIALLQSISEVAAMAHAPFIAGVHPKMFGISAVHQLADLKDIKAIFEGPAYAKWRSFRDSESSRYVALTLPRFLLRQPYHPEHHPVKGFAYEEPLKRDEDYVWGNSSFALATRIADSFAQYRWCPNIVGPHSGGSVQNLPLHFFEAMGEVETKIPTEVLISDRREYELSLEGFISLAFRKGTDEATFFSASSVQRPQHFGQNELGKAKALNFKLGTQLPYLLIVCRIAHYLKVLQREQLGSWKEAPDLQEQLSKWMGQYVADQENAPTEIRSRRPLRSAQILVSTVPEEAGWYRVDIHVRPHFKYMGADITLSLVGQLDRPK